MFGHSVEFEKFQKNLLFYLQVTHKMLLEFFEFLQHDKVR